MDDLPVKIAKITIRVDYADGSAIEAQAVEPHDMAVNIAYPDPEYDLSNPTRLVSTQPAPTVTLCFTADRDRGFQERYISRAEREEGETQA